MILIIQKPLSSIHSAVVLILTLAVIIWQGRRKLLKNSLFCLFVFIQLNLLFGGVLSQ